uniref:Uncharacterized protein n=1 Tax=Hordeum vulgare subsp. vulgare TaxID=112509 RepID=A0A8I6WVJ4_HORVV
MRFPGWALYNSDDWIGFCIHTHTHFLYFWEYVLSDSVKVVPYTQMYYTTLSFSIYLITYGNMPQYKFYEKKK